MSGEESVSQPRSPGPREHPVAGAQSRRVIMASVVLVVLLAAIAVVSWPKPSSSGLASSPSPTTYADRVDVVYFHRTERCQTCLWTGKQSTGR
jgi:hypothetical protein